MKTLTISGMESDTAYGDTEMGSGDHSRPLTHVSPHETSPHPPLSAPPRLSSSSSGMALVIILAILVMVTGLVVALLTLAGGERSAASLSLHRAQAEMLADAAANEAMAKISTAVALGSGTGKSWASEPGRIWTFDIDTTSGAITKQSHDLLSALPDAAAGNVDLNKPSLSGEYPIAPNAEMKIGWKNILRDPSQSASADNPIVGRVAYWVDDESTKLNINTADGSRKYNDGRYGTFPTANPTVGYSFGFGTPSEISLAGLPGGLITQAEAGAIADTAWDEEFNSIDELTRAKDAGGNPVVTAAEVDALRFDITHYNSSPDVNFMGEPRIALLPLFNDATPVENTFIGETQKTDKQGGGLDGKALDALYPQPSQLPRPSFLPAANGAPTDRWYLHTFAESWVQLLSENSADYLVGDLIANLLNGTNLQGDTFTWPAFPGADSKGFAGDPDIAGSVGKYTDRQIDSITLQILDTLKATMLDQGGYVFSPPAMMEEGWLSGDPVLGVGRFARLNEVRLIADVTTGDPLGYGAKIGNPSPPYEYPLLQLQIYYEFYFPKGFAGMPNYPPYEDVTRQSAFYGWKPNYESSLNFVDWYVDTDTSNGDNDFDPPAWRNRVFHAVDQNGAPAGIDFAGTSSQVDDPDQAAAALHHPYAKKFKLVGSVYVPQKDALGNNIFTGSMYWAPPPPEENEHPGNTPILAMRGPFGSGDDLFPGVYSMKGNLNPTKTYPADPDATKIHLQGGLQFWVRYWGNTYGYRLSTLAPYESALPTLMGDTSLPLDFVERVLPVDFTIPVPGHREYLLRVSDPLVNQYPADWQAITNPAAADRTMPDSYSYMIDTVAQTYIKGGDAARDPFFGHPDMPSGGNMPRAIESFDGDNPGFKPSGGGDPLSIWMPRLDPRIPKLARFPSVGALFSIRTGLFPDKAVVSKDMIDQYGTPWRALNMAPSTQSSQGTNGGTSYPDWAMLDLFYVPFLPQKPYGPAVPGNPGPQPFRRLTYGGATIGRININNPPVPYPFAEDGVDATDPKRQALEALFFNLQPSDSYDAGGDPVYDTIDAAEAADLAQAVADYQDTHGPFFMAGQIANVPAVAEYLYTGVAANAESRNDLVRETIGAITTRSNVYSIWVVAQTIQKAPGNTDYGNFEAGDSITAEVRRHYLVERVMKTGVDGVPGNAVNPSVSGAPNAYADAKSSGDPVTPGDPVYQPELSYPLPYRWRVLRMESIQL